MATNQGTENADTHNNNRTANATNDSFQRPKEVTARTQRRMKLRRLYDASRQEAMRNAEATSLIEPNVRAYLTKTIAIRVFLTTSLTFTLALIILNASGHINISGMIDDFNAKYTNQYMSIMHNKVNYCERDVDLKDMFVHLNREVLHQGEALSKLEIVLRNQSSTQSVAIIGSSGIGKSLTARLLREHYPWPANVQIFAYNMHMLATEQKLYRIEYMLENMSKCGRNLFIIDNLLPDEYEIINNVNQLVKQKDKYKETNPQDCKDKDDYDCVAANRHTINKHITILYIFNLNMLLPYSVFEKQKEFLQKIPDTTVIDYQSFERKHLADCINNELRLEKMVIDEEHFNEILDYTDVEESGCKTTRSKVLLYGRYEEKVKRELETKNYVIRDCYD